MPEAENRLALMQEARDEALATIVEADREAKASILQPAIGREMAPHERLTAQTTYLSDMLLTGL